MNDLSSSFSPEMFLDAAITEVSTRRPALPAGLELLGTVKPGGIKASKRTFKDKTTQEDRTETVIEVPVEIDLTIYPEVNNQQGGINQLTMTDSVFLEVNAAGAIDMTPGKNRKMRNWRDATNNNVPGQTFTWRMLEGRQVKVKISHRVADGETYDQIGSVSKP